MNKRLAMGVVSALCMAVLPVGSGAQEADETEPVVCGIEPVTIAQMQWPSAAVLAHVHGYVIETGLGCTTQVVSGDLGATASSMASTGRPLVAPEFWLGRIAALWNSAIEAEKVRPGGQTFGAGALEGWYVPQFVADNWPELKSVADISEHLPSFTRDGGRPRFISCPPDWACAVINRNLLRAHGLDRFFEVIEPTNRFEMDQLIADATARRQPILFYYWQPNGFLAQFDVTPLDMGDYVADAMNCLAQRQCSSPEPSAFAPEQVVVALSEDVFLNAPRIAQYFQRAAMPLDTLNAVLAWQNENEASVEDTAAHFITTYPAIWQAWLNE